MNSDTKRDARRKPTRDCKTSKGQDFASPIQKKLMRCGRKFYFVDAKPEAKSKSS